MLYNIILIYIIITEEAYTLEIQWITNSCFYIKTSIGKRILLDPFNIDKSFMKLDVIPNIISLSSTSVKLPTDFDQSDIIIHNNYTTYKNDFIKLYPYKSFSDNSNGAKRGENIIKFIEIDNLKLCHLGYLGHLPTNDIIEYINSCDILFIPIGGNLCLNGLEATKLISKLKCPYIIPMLFKSSLSTFYFDGPFKFITNHSNILSIDGSTLNTSELIKPKDLPLIILLKPLII